MYIRGDLKVYRHLLFSCLWVSLLSPYSSSGRACLQGVPPEILIPTDTGQENRSRSERAATLMWHQRAAPRAGEMMAPSVECLLPKHGALSLILHTYVKVRPVGTSVTPCAEARGQRPVGPWSPLIMHPSWIDQLQAQWETLSHATCRK